jgi:hypothetical protein
MRTRLICLGLVAVAAAAAVATLAPGARGASGTTTPRCTVRDLAVWLGDGPGGASAGHVVYPIEFSNISDHTCHLLGFPGVSAARRHQIGLPADRSGGPPQLVTLAPRQTGHTLVQFTDVGVIDPSVCKPTTAEVIRVYPPGARNYAEIDWQFGACRSKSITFMDVQPVQPRVGIPGF